MKKLAIVFAVGAAALMGGSAAYAADNAVKSKPSTDATRPQLRRNRRPTSARNTAIGIGMAITMPSPLAPPSLPAALRELRLLCPAPYGYYGGPRYYGGGPGVTFSFGSGGYRGW